MGIPTVVCNSMGLFQLLENAGLFPDPAKGIITQSDSNPARARLPENISVVESMTLG